MIGLTVPRFGSLQVTGFSFRAALQTVGKKSVEIISLFDCVVKSVVQSERMRFVPLARNMWRRRGGASSSCFCCLVQKLCREELSSSSEIRYSVITARTRRASGVVLVPLFYIKSLQFGQSEPQSKAERATERASPPLESPSWEQSSHNVLQADINPPFFDGSEGATVQAF